jgi:hypothetical protein
MPASAFEDPASEILTEIENLEIVSRVGGASFEFVL